MSASNIPISFPVSALSARPVSFGTQIDEGKDRTIDLRHSNSLSVFRPNGRI